MEFIRYEYPIQNGNNHYTGSFTLKADAKHPEIVEQLKAHEVQRFHI